MTMYAIPYRIAWAYLRLRCQRRRTRNTEQDVFASL